MKVNLALLKKLYLINHPCGEENAMISFIINYCYKIPHLTFTLDSYGNLYITKNTTNPDYYPCLIAHTDTVHFLYKPREIVVKDGIITAQYIDTQEQCGLNADDSNGILICLQMLETLPNLKVCFTIEEESGGKGAQAASDNYEFFSNVKCLLEPDRRGKSDLITYTNNKQCASSELIDDIKQISDLYEYTPTTGIFTDVGILCPNLCIAGVNISCGYYNEHTNKEMCVIKELSNCLNYIYSIILHLPDKLYFLQQESLEKTDEDYTYPKEKDFPCNHCSTFDCMYCSNYPY